MNITFKIIVLFSVFFHLNTFLYSQQKTDSIAFQQVDDFLKENNKAKAMRLALKKLDSAKTNNDITLQIDWNTKIGKIFRHSNFEKSLGYFNTSKQLSLITKDSLQMSSVYFNIGSLYLLKFSNDTYKAQDINVSKEIKDSALVYFNSILKDFKHIKGTKAVVAKTYANLTGLYSYTGKQKEVEILAKKAILYFEAEKDTIGIVGVKSNLGINQLYQGQYKKAEQNYLDALPYLKDTTDLRILDIKSTNFANLSQVYQATKEYKKALDYEVKAQLLRLIYVEKNKEKELVEIEAKYNLDVAIAKENSKTLKVKAEKEKLQSRLIVMSLLGLSILLVVLFLYRSSKLKLIKKELVYQQEIQILQKKSQNKVVAATLDGRLEERKQISEVLHDNVSALLSSANMHLQVVKKKCSGSIQEISKTQQILDEALNKVRNLSQQLVPSVLVKFGLISAIEDLCEKHSNADLAFRLDCTDKKNTFDKQLELKVYSILEECFNNILKHSKATQAIVSLESVKNHLEIEIFDNGIGFDTELSIHDKGTGLHQIKARVEALNGALKITTIPNKFTKIIMKIPI